MDHPLASDDVSGGQVKSVLTVVIIARRAAMENICGCTWLRVGTILIEIFLRVTC